MPASQIEKDDSYNECELTRSPEPNSSRRRLQGWRSTIVYGVCLCVFVLITNLTLLGWSRHNAISTDGDTCVVFQGDCDRTKAISMYSHLAINILSTLLLSASNAGMQSVGAPTRADLDAAHEEGTWLHVGVAGLRNLQWISWKRRALWGLLALSSVPIHLLCATQVGVLEEGVIYGGPWSEINETRRITFATPLSTATEEDSYMQPIHLARYTWPPASRSMPQPPDASTSFKRAYHPPS